jgi:hypothetical protein
MKEEGATFPCLHIRVFTPYSSPNPKDLGSYMEGVEFVYSTP